MTSIQLYFGSHNDNSNLINGANEVIKSGGNLIQIFLTNGNKFKHYSKAELSKYKTHLNKHNAKVVIHSSYQHNLCRDWSPQSWWIKNIILELQTADFIGAIGLVIHFGKRKELSLQQAYNNMFSSLVYIHTETKKINVPIFLETPTGQGTQICYELADLSYFYKKFKNSQDKSLKDRFKLCLDTCHIFTAGYDIRTKESITRFLNTFEELIGIRHIKLLHLNDSKVDIGTMVDRHENIGKGFIGFKPLKIIFDYFVDLGVPIVLETPDDGFKEEIGLLKNI